MRNKKIQICLIDDNEDFLQYMQCLIPKISTKLETEIEIYCCKEYTDIDDSIDFDIFFLDIEMPDISGYDIAEKLVERISSKIVYVTGVNEHVYDSFRHYAYDFIRKSCLQEDLMAVLMRCIKDLNSEISVMYKGMTIIIPTRSILLIRMNRNELTIYYCQRELTIRQSLNKFLNDNGTALKDGFVQVNRSEIVHLRFVVSYNNPVVYLHTGEKIFVTKKYVELFQRKYYTYTSR